MEAEVYKNLSRLTSQWEEIINEAIFKTQKEAEHRLEELALTVRHLLSAEEPGTKARVLPCLRAIQDASEMIGGSSA